MADTERQQMHGAEGAAREDLAKRIRQRGIAWAVVSGCTARVGALAETEKRNLHLFLGKRAGAEAALPDDDFWRPHRLHQGLFRHTHWREGRERELQENCGVAGPRSTRSAVSVGCWEGNRSRERGGFSNCPLRSLREIR